MRVLIDTSFGGRGPSGTAVYLQCLVPALRELGVDVVEAADERRRPPAGGGLGSVRNFARDLRWRRRALVERARDAHAGVLHHPLPARSPRAPCAQVITVHDLAFELRPQDFDRRFGAYARRAHRAAARAADAVITVSEATKRDVVDHWGVDAARIVVAPHGPGQALGVTPAEPRHVLYVGDDEPRKDLATLRAADLPLPLVLAGRAGREVSGAELADLFAHAAALVHPSRHEGFGLTLLEAMAAGVPVVAARNDATEEVAGGAAVLVAPGDPAALAAGVREALARRDELVSAGRERANRFTWQRSARMHLEAYTLAAESHG